LAASILAIAVVIFNCQNLINGLIWSEDDNADWWDGKILCDVEVKLYIGLNMVVVGAIACILRQVAMILDPDHILMTPSRGRRRRKIMIEASLCLFAPTLLMINHYLVQPSRYWIAGQVGCIPTLDNSWLQLPMLILPVLVCLISCCYCVLILVRLYRHRKEMSLLQTITSTMPSSRFWRLVALSFILLAVYLPLEVISMYHNCSARLHPFSWKFVHPDDWSEKFCFDCAPNGLPFDRWAQIGTGYVLFFTFGLGHDAGQMYKSWARKGKGIWQRVFRGKITLSGLS
jgi:pheromone a factor receptor